MSLYLWDKYKGLFLFLSCFSILPKAQPQADDRIVNKRIEVNNQPPVVS